MIADRSREGAKGAKKDAKGEVEVGVNFYEFRERGNSGVYEATEAR